MVVLSAWFHHRDTENTEMQFFLCPDEIGATNKKHQSCFEQEFLAEGLSYL